MLVDTHCHLNSPDAFPDPETEIEAARQAGVHRMILVGTKPDEWESTVALAEQHPELFCILGWHPNYTAGYEPAGLDPLRHLLGHPKVLGLGEIGLDFHWSYSPVETQRTALIAQLDLAQELNVPVVFHAREAYGALLDLLEQRERRPYLFHCFAGDAEEAQRAVALDAYFGVDGPITYKKADDLRAVVRSLPIDRIVVETDAPYLSPVPHRGKPNRPAHVRYVAEALGEVFGLGEEQIADTTTENAVRFFGERLRVES